MSKIKNLTDDLIGTSCPRCLKHTDRIHHGYHGHATHGCTCLTCVGVYHDRTGAWVEGERYSVALDPIDHRPCGCKSCIAGDFNYLFHPEKIITGVRNEYTAKARTKALSAIEQRLLSATSPLESFSASFSPRGFYVYLLWGADEHLIYVGKSTNVIARLGDHMRDPAKRDRVERVQVIKCDTKDGMSELEMSLILKYQPELNIAGK